MPSGLFALLDDVATIAKVAAASIDDIGAAASKAGVKAAGVVVDDAAVTPRYVTGFQPNRELPIIWRIAKGSFLNKLVLILPALLLLSAVAQWAITPLLMVGGAYLCFEGAEKVWHSLHKDKTPLAEAAEIVADKDHEETMVKGAVGLIVKMDDIGLHMAKAGNSVRRAIGRGLVAFMPKLLGALALVGTAAMLWVGGQIILHALDEYHIGNLGHGLHDFAHAVAGNLPAAGVWEWLINAGGAGVFGLVLGGLIVAVMHLVPGKKEEAAH